MERDGTISGVVVTGRDLTELKRAEDKLRDNEEQLRSLVQDIAVVSARVSSEKKIVAIGFH